MKSTFLPLRRLSAMVVATLAPAIPKQNRLDIVATNISEVTIHPKRARVNCNAVVNVQSDGPITVTLAGCSKDGRPLP